MYDGNADKATVMLVLSGNSEAYGDIVHRYKDTIFGTIYSMIKNYHTAEDLTQDTFVDGYIKLKSLGEPYNVGAWLIKIAKNKCYNYLTRSAMKHESELYDYMPDPRMSSPENFLIAQEGQNELKKSVQRLPELQRIVTELYYFDNYSQNEIAEMLKVPIGTISRRLYDARLKLKKELGYMSEVINNTNFEEEVAKRIRTLKDYYHLNNFSSDGKEKVVKEFIKFIDDMPESKLKHHAYYVAYSYSDKEEHKSLAEKEAELAENADVYFDKFWDKYANKNDDEKWLEAIDSKDEGIARMEKMQDSENAVGQMYFWRGCCNLKLGNLKEARKDNETALKKLDKENSYHPNAIAALKIIDALEANGSEYMMGNLNMTGELFRLYDNGKRLDFINQPGYGLDSSMIEGKNRYDSVYYYSAGLKKSRKFFDLNIKEGETSGEDTLVSKCETVTVLAGTFENCIHVKSVSEREWLKNEETVTESWYAKDVGLVKMRAKSNGHEEEIYELSEYKIKGGDGYFPAFEGNVWRYKNINLPDFYEQNIEFETVSVFEKPETGSKYLYVSASQSVRIAKDNLDSDIHISLAEKAVPYRVWSEKPKKMDFDTAIENLKLAVQKNTSIRASLYAESAVEYLERFKQYHEKRWHLLPCCSDAKVLIKDNKNGKISVSDADGYYIAPSQDWGAWFDERKCLARSPIRYLQELFGVIYNDKWIIGYTEQIKHRHGEIQLKAEDGGVITTKAGTFNNCIKVTVELEKADETDEKYYINTPRYSHCGTKIYYYAPNVGIVKYECIWGKALYASMELTEYKSYATKGEYMPVFIGNTWIYDEVTLPDKFTEKTKYKIASGMEDEFFMICEGDVLFMGTDEEYDEFKKSLDK